MDGRASSLVVVGASAGGMEPLKEVISGLPADLPAAVAVVLHIPAQRSRLPEILSRVGPLPAAHAKNGEPLLPSRIYVAPPDHHLLVHDFRCVVVRGPRENGVRPALDPLFRSAALSFGDRTIAVVLSGARSDGSAGAAAISARGGTVIVQDPQEADFPGMPRSAIARDHPDGILGVGRIANAVAAAVRGLPKEAEVRENGRDEMSVSTSYAALDRETIELCEPPDEPSAFSCPASEEVDKALWAAFRALHERADLSSRSARRSRDRGSKKVADRLEENAREALDQAELIRTIILERDASGS